MTAVDHHSNTSTPRAYNDSARCCCSCQTRADGWGRAVEPGSRCVYQKPMSLAARENSRLHSLKMRTAMQILAVRGATP